VPAPVRELPLAVDVGDFIAEPLASLAAARAAHGDAFAIRAPGPIFSRAADCAGVACVLGAALTRRVLSDLDVFGMPPSAARQLRFDAPLANLNRGLHSMRGREHDAHKRLLTAVLNARGADAVAAGGWDAAQRAATRALGGGAFGLMAFLRALTVRTATSLLLGDQDPDRDRLASLLQTYFFLRREASSPAAARDDRALDELRSAGHALDDALRAYVRCCRSRGAAASGLLAKLAGGSAPGSALTEDELVGHANILFVSATEPLAVALTWTLLILSQLPALRGALREELRAVAGDGVPNGADVERLALLDRVVNESLRLLPPNAFMVRLTTEPVQLGAFLLPARCEVVLCPYLAHRDPAAFERPDTFWPDRWKQPPPSPFQYLPFGAGGHACIGKPLAMRTMKTLVAALLSAYDLVLAGDQEIDWRLHIQFMPASDPSVLLVPLGTALPPRPGRLRGPVRDMIRLDDA
jgi:cytochrome P450